MNRYLLMTVVLAVAGFGIAVFLTREEAPDLKESIARSLEAVKLEQEIVTEALPKKAVTGEFPVPSSSGPWPKAVTQELNYAFGRMQLGTTKSHSFTIRNEGEAELQLTAGTTTCKCTEFDFDPSEDVELKSVVVKPGESIDLIIRWKSGENVDRAFRHGGDVHTNDPKNRLIRYTVEGAIERMFDVMPGMWNLGGISAGEPGRFKAAITSRLFEQFEVESIRSPSGMVMVTPVPMTPEEKAEDRYSSGYSLQVEVSENLPAGTFTEHLEIRILGQEEAIPVTLTARKYGAIRLLQMAGTEFNAEKLVLQLGAFPASLGREAKILLIVDEKDMPEPFQLKETQADPSFLKASLTPVGEPTGTVRRYLLTLRIPPGRPHVQRVEAKPGSLRISTNHPTGEEIAMTVLLYSN